MGVWGIGVVILLIGALLQNDTIAGFGLFLCMGTVLIKVMFKEFSKMLWGE